MDALEVSRRRINHQLRHRDQVDSAVSARSRINYRGGRYADLGRHLAASAIVRGRLVRAEHRHMPKRRAGAVGVEGVHGVILGDDIDHVVCALAGILTLVLMSGCASTNPSTLSWKSWPNEDLTLVGVRICSVRFCPVRSISL